MVFTMRYMHVEDTVPLIKAATPTKLEPRTTVKKLPWLDGNFPPGYFDSNGGSVHIPGDFDATIETPETPQVVRTAQTTPAAEPTTRTKHITRTEVSETGEVTEIDEEIIETDEIVETEEVTTTTTEDGVTGTEELAKKERTGWAEQAGGARAQQVPQTGQATQVQGVGQAEKVDQTQQATTAAQASQLQRASQAAQSSQTQQATQAGQVTQTDRVDQTRQMHRAEPVAQTDNVNQTQQVSQAQKITQKDKADQATPIGRAAESPRDAQMLRKSTQRTNSVRFDRFQPTAKGVEPSPSPTRGRRPSFIRATIKSLTSAPVIQSTSSNTREERRRSSLAPVPAHLEDISSSSERVDERTNQVTETVATVPSTQRIDQVKENAIVMPSTQRIDQRTKTVTAAPLDRSEYSEIVEAQRRSSLAPVPAHLQDLEEVSPSLERAEERFQYEGERKIAPEVIVKSAELQPTQPIPKRNVFDRARGKRRLSDAIENLEGMVQEAVDIADHNADTRQVQEVHDIIQDATVAVREAATAPAHDLMVTVSPLPITDSESSESWSPSMKRRTKQLKQQQQQTQDPTQSGAAKKTVVEDTVTTTTTTASKDLSPTATPTERDFAYKDHQVRKASLLASERLLPPKPVQSSTREHTEFVLRPTRTQPDIPVRDSSRKRKVKVTEPDGAQGRRGLRQRRQDEYSSEDYRMEYKDQRRVDSQFDSDEEKLHFVGKPYDNREYGPGLRVRDHENDQEKDHGHHTFSLRRHHTRQPISRNWSTFKKRVTATIACINTALIGIIVGIYAGEVPGIQYTLGDERHHVILGNVVLFAGLAISTFIFWPLPLLHGRKPYILAALVVAMPLQFPQAMVVSKARAPRYWGFRTGLLLARAFTGLVLGFAYINFLPMLLDLFGASLQSKNPHQELVIVNDVRRHGGGMGIWLGIWSWCAIASLAVGFQIGAVVIEKLTPDWGFYIVIMILIVAIIINILTPETRRSSYRRSVTEVYDRDENFITRRVARGEIKLHLGPEGPKYSFEEVWAGIILTTRMCLQPGFLVLAFYLGWIYTQIVLVIVLLGALLSRDYRWTPRYVGLGVMSIAFGAFAAIPLTKAGIFSRERKKPYRTDSMTFEKQVSWSSHLVRRIIFTVALPLMGVAYTVSSSGRPRPYMVPIVFAGAIGFFSILAIAECLGLIMETFDTCDLQPGVNTRHRLQSMAVQDQRRRTNYSSFPRVSAGIFASQTLAFIGAAVATEVGGIMTRHIGAMASTGVTAGILLALTILLTAVLWRYSEIQVIPNYTGTNRDSKSWEQFKEIAQDDWKAVVIGNPSGKMRRMNVLEMGSLSRWTEIRKLNYLIRDDKGIKLQWRPQAE